MEVIQSHRIEIKMELIEIRFTNIKLFFEFSRIYSVLTIVTWLYKYPCALSKKLNSEHLPDYHAQNLKEKYPNRNLYI